MNWAVPTLSITLGWPSLIFFGCVGGGRLPLIDVCVFGPGEVWILGTQPPTVAQNNNHNYLEWLLRCPHYGTHTIIRETGKTLHSPSFCSINGLCSTLLCTCSCFFPLFLPSAFLRPSSCWIRSVVAGVVITAPVAKRRSRSRGLGKVLGRPRRPHCCSAVSVVRRRRILERSLSCLRSCYLESLA